MFYDTGASITDLSPSHKGLTVGLLQNDSAFRIAMSSVFLPGICENDGTPDVHPHHPEDLDVDWFIQVAQSKKLKAAHHAAGRTHVTVLTDEVLRKKDAE